MPLSRSEARRLILHLVALPHEKEGLYGLTNAAFKAANIPECRIIGDVFEYGTGHVAVGGVERWCQIVDKAQMMAFAYGKDIIKERC